MKGREYKIIGETEFAVQLLYNGRECGFARDTHSSIEEFLDFIDKWDERDKEEDADEKTRRASLTADQRTAEDEYRHSLYERMQSEQDVVTDKE